MELKTEQLLSTLEILLEKELVFFLPEHHQDTETLKPYVWDATEGAFTPLRVIQSEGWIRQTDLEVAVTDWQWSEHSGLAAKSILNNDPSCLSGDDEENILLDDAVKSERAEKYQALLELLKASLENLQAFTLSCSPGYSLSIIVGQITEKRWICLSPNVPQETPEYVNDEMKCSVYIDVETRPKPKEEMSEIELQIQAALEEISRIKIYGWYDGGYDRVHDYQIAYGVGNSRDQAIEQALAVAGLVEIYKFEHFVLGKQLCGYGEEKAKEVEERFQHLSQFLSQTFPDLKLYRFCFWDYEHLYIVGQSATEERVGIVIRSQFTYNP